ncbi:MAG TPA: hypothetical protein VFJ96_02150 [Gemmatimonadaceae bacterium]|jgi:hypothetical protein|nr:hypothetical protein [Gemmatimonadaceae bacterium]
MLQPRIALLSLALITVSACSSFNRQSAPVKITDTGAITGTRWNAVLATPTSLRGALQINGTAWMAPDSGHTVVSVAISNAPPGGIHPWEVHVGRCGSIGQTLGTADAYTPLKVASNGTASAQVNLNQPLSASVDYSVNVHAASDNMSTIIACGNFAPPIR